VLGIHFTDVPFWHLFQEPTDLSGAEKTFLAAADQWQQKEGAYAFIQGTRPQTLAPAPNDSPGLAAWIVEKFRAWSGRRQRRDPLHQGRAPGQRHAVLGHRDDRLVIPALP